MSQFFVSDQGGPGEVDSITGTEDQVLANGTFGTPQTGAVTLTTPQDIATDSDVQFGSVQVDDGTVNDPSYSFKDETGLGIFRSGSQSMTFAANGNSIMGVSSGAIQPLVTCELSAGLSLKYAASATDYVATLYIDCIIGITNTAAPRSVTLPGVGSQASLYIIKDESGGAAANNITISAAGGKTINGAASFAINTNYGSATVYYNGTNYFVI